MPFKFNPLTGSIDAVNSRRELLTISGAEPRLVFTDEDNDPDYTLWANSTNFSIHSSTVGSVLNINSSGDATFAGNVDVNHNAVNTGSSPILKITNGTAVSGGKNYSLRVNRPGVSNTGFTIYNESDTRNEFSIDGSGNATFAGDIKLADTKQIIARGPANNIYGELDIKVVAADDSGSNNVATFKKATNGVILEFPSGGGINFHNYGAEESPDNAATDVTANTLDDYEEGTWTPVLQHFSGGAYQNVTMTTAGTISQPKYTKVGRWVTATFAWSGFQVDGGTLSYARVTGLPFTSGANGAALVGKHNCFSQTQSIGGWLANGQTSIDFYYSASNANNWISSAGSELQLSCHYQV